MHLQLRVSDRAWRSFADGGAVCAIGAAAAGCTTEFQYGGANSTDRAVVYVAKVDDKAVASTQIAASSNLAPTSLGKVKRGRKVGVDVTLPEGGRVSEQFQILTDKPDPTVISPQTAKIPGIHVDFGTASDIENSISNISASFRSPTPFVDNLISSSLGGIYLVTENPADAANPWVTQLYGPAEIGSSAPASFFSDGQFPEKLSVILVLDKEAATQVAADVPTVATVRADFSQSSVHKYSMTLKNTGWRVLPTSWSQASRQLGATESGRKILSDISSRISALRPGQHIYYLDQAYIVGSLDVATYQAHALDANTNIQASTYVTAMGAFKVSDDAYDSKNASNIVLRVKYEDLSLAAAPLTPAVNPVPTHHGARTPTTILGNPAARKSNRFPF